MAEPIRAERVDWERPAGPARESEESRKEQTGTDVKCVCAYCGDSMVREKLPRFNRGFGIGLLILGILLSFFALFVGLPLVAIGAYMGVASRAVWVCQACAAVVDRNDH